MKLNKLQRHTAYIIMLSEFRKHVPIYSTGSWFCYLIWDMFRIDDIGFKYGDEYSSIVNVMRHLPELNKLFHEIFPAHDDLDTREKILKKCIEETY